MIGSLRKLIVVFLFSSFFLAQTCYAKPAAYNSAAIATGIIAGAGVIGFVIITALSSHDDHDPASNNAPAVNKDNENDTNGTGGLEDAGVFFSSPGTQYLELANNSTKPITVNSITLTGNIYNVSLVTASGNCQLLSPGSTCKVPLEATQDAYGSGQAVVTYNNNHTFIASIMVADTTLMLTEASNPQQADIIVKTNNGTPVTRTFLYTNTGNFSWQNPSISWQVPFDNPTGEVVTINNNTCTGTSILPNNSCAFDLTVNYDNPGDWGVLQTVGTNINTYLKNFFATNGLSVAINQDPESNHLGYRSIKITNTIADPNVGRNMWISGITVGGNLLDGLKDLNGNQLPPVVKYCAKDDDPTDSETCIYKTQDCNISPGSTPSISLTSGKSCLVWFKARGKNFDGTDIDLQSVPSTSGTITVTVIGKKEQTQKGSSPAVYDWVDFTDYERSSTFTASYDKSLYVGGKFGGVGSGTTNTNYIAKWNGSLWSALNTSASLSGMVFALTSMNGDLYVGGGFTNAGSLAVNYISKWDGSAWSGLSSSTDSNAGVNGTVYALTSLNNTLYVGGSFTTIKNGITLKNIAMWNGSSWGALNDGTRSSAGTNNTVYALTDYNNDLYVGGWFTEIMNSVADFIGKWSSLSGGWSVLPASTNGAIYALANMNGNIYAGGEFSSADTTNNHTTVNNIAMWDIVNEKWLALWNGAAVGVSSPVYTLMPLNGDLYVGGKFTTAGTTTVNNVAKWNNTNWLPLVNSSDGTPGVTGGGVYAIANLNGKIYLGGEFNSAGGMPQCYCITAWDSERQTWSELDGGITQGSGVYALAIAPALTIVGYS